MSFEQRPESNEKRALTLSGGRAFLVEQQASGPLDGQAAGMLKYQQGGQSARARVMGKERRPEGSCQPG